MTLPQIPLVSIAITTYNSAKFIQAALDSALAQDYANIEIIVSDDASIDNTVEIVQKYIDKCPDKIKLLTADKNVGAHANWFKCVANCKGKYITGLAGDDKMLPQKISKQVAVMENDPDIVICYSDASVFHVPTQKEIYRLSYKSPTKSGGIKTALADSIYYSPTIMFQKQFAPQKNIFSKIKHAADLAYYKEIMILSAPSGKIHYLPEVLYIYNKHESNLTSINSNENYKEHIEAIKILQKTYPEYKSYLDPSICDFSCVGFFKSLICGRFRESYYFLSHGLKSAGYNPLKLLRAVLWGAKFYIRLLVSLRSKR